MSDRSVDPRTRAGDPSASRLELLAELRSEASRPSCPSCFGGYVTITHEEDGQEIDEAVPCRHCARGE